MNFNDSVQGPNYEMVSPKCIEICSEKSEKKATDKTVLHATKTEERDTIIIF